jgi:hypothetical protein
VTSTKTRHVHVHDQFFSYRNIYIGQKLAFIVRWGNIVQQKVKFFSYDWSFSVNPTKDYKFTKKDEILDFLQNKLDRLPSNKAGRSFTNKYFVGKNRIVCVAAWNDLFDIINDYAIPMTSDSIHVLTHPITNPDPTPMTSDMAIEGGPSHSQPRSHTYDIWYSYWRRPTPFPTQVPHLWHMIAIHVLTHPIPNPGPLPMTSDIAIEGGPPHSQLRAYYMYI